jgi:hypothetical protein
MERLAGDDPAILAGDFNFTRTSRYYSAMTAAAAPPVPVTDSPRPLSPGREAGWVEPGDELIAADRIDFVWTREGVEFEWHPTTSVRQIYGSPAILASGESVPLSDHPVLMSTLCLVRVGDESDRCLALEPEASDSRSSR